MLEVLYRIYQVPEESQQKSIDEIAFGFYSSTSRNSNIELLMDVIICDTRDEFKSIIRDTYGNIPFAYSKKLQPGDMYCIIIGEHAYSATKYFNRIEFECDNCHSHVTTYYDRPIAFSEHEIKWDLYNIDEYRSKRFCCTRCMSEYKEREKRTLQPEEGTEFFVTRDMFTSNISGYIYKITKKSTQQFYVGQTRYAPMFRWAEHLKTDRFPISNIEDYQYEVLEIVPKGTNILERETYWIQSLYKENPDLSLNISQTQQLRKQFDPNQQKMDLL